MNSRKRDLTMEFVETAWRMRAPRSRILVCAILRSAHGFEARMGYGSTILASHYARDLEVACAGAEMFQQAALDNGHVDIPRAPEEALHGSDAKIARHLTWVGLASDVRTVH